MKKTIAILSFVWSIAASALATSVSAESAFAGPYATVGYSLYNAQGQSSTLGNFDGAAQGAVAGGGLNYNISSSFIAGGGMRFSFGNFADPSGGPADQRGYSNLQFSALAGLDLAHSFMLYGTLRYDIVNIGAPHGNALLFGGGFEAKLNPEAQLGFYGEFLTGSSSRFDGGSVDLTDLSIGLKYYVGSEN